MAVVVGTDDVGATLEGSVGALLAVVLGTIDEIGSNVGLGTGELDDWRVVLGASEMGGDGVVPSLTTI